MQTGQLSLQQSALAPSAVKRIISAGILPFAIDTALLTIPIFNHQKEKEGQKSRIIFRTEIQDLTKTEIPNFNIIASIKKDIIWG